MIGVFVRRRGDFKILGSTLDALTVRDMAWGWIIDHDGKDDPQAEDFMRWGGHRQLLSKPNILLAADAEYVPDWKIPTVTIPYFWDNRLAPQLPGRIVCYTSERHLRLVQKLQPGTPTGPIVGWTEGDAWMLLQRSETSRYLNLGEPWRNSRTNGHRQACDHWEPMKDVPTWCECGHLEECHADSAFTWSR